MELLRKTARWVATRPWLTNIRPVVLGADKVLYKLTKGRITVVGIAGMPSLTLTVTGRKTGLPRTSPCSTCQTATTSCWSAPTGAARATRCGRRT
ncbi:hypothetical protein GCM10029964_033650 [Kibdelosporangium lantanae]